VTPRANQRSVFGATSQSQVSRVLAIRTWVAIRAVASEMQSTLETIHTSIQQQQV